MLTLLQTASTHMHGHPSVLKPYPQVTHTLTCTQLATFYSSATPLPSSCTLHNPSPCAPLPSLQTVKRSKKVQPGRLGDLVLQKGDVLVLSTAPDFNPKSEDFRSNFHG